MPFFTMSGSVFVEVFVGVGHPCARPLPPKPRRRRPASLIDEIDAVGLARSKNAGFQQRRTREYAQTSSDGDGRFSVPIRVSSLLAATNRADILDKAPHACGGVSTVEVRLPDVKGSGRRYYSTCTWRNIKLDPNLDRDFLAKQTPGFSGADIANVRNEGGPYRSTARQEVRRTRDFQRHRPNRGRLGAGT